MSRPFVIAALVLPLLAVAFGISKSEYQLNQTEWHFPVLFYDPRDLLRGHYLSYRIDYGEESQTACSSSRDCCLCLTRTGEKSPPHITWRDCGEARYCDGFIVAGHLENLNRYYIPEDKQRQYGELLSDAHPKKRIEIVLSIDRRGYPVVKQLEIDGNPIAQSEKHRVAR